MPDRGGASLSLATTAAFTGGSWAQGAGSRPGSGLDRDLDGLSVLDDRERVEDAVEGDVLGDQVLDGYLAGRDVLQGPLVVLGRRAVGAVDVQLAVVHQVAVALDERVGLRQPAEEGDAPV